MSFNSTDLSFWFSTGGGPAELRELNLGGAISATAEIVHSTEQNWAPDIPRTVVGAIGTAGTWSMYFPFYVKNKHASITVTDVALTVLSDVSGINVAMQMGFDPAGKNGTCQTIVNQTTSPTGVTFDDPITVLFGGWFSETTVWNAAASLAPDDNVPMWIRLYGPKGVSSIPVIKFTLKASFIRPA
ncbi:MAG: hypothetical protein L0H53_00765 [Candidatus Nitrosocosmicus sp.]|nr:hypothetical protein [Candidatus Nitrosocosmicus sp.]MDN5865949.1 hypothetical protein [Candidatus Nitrosocosmicus sp.]